MPALAPPAPAALMAPAHAHAALVARPGGAARPLRLAAAQRAPRMAAPRGAARLPHRRPQQQQQQQLVVAGLGMAHPGEEREGTRSGPLGSLPAPAAALGRGGGGLGSSGRGATMERSKLSLKQEVRQSGAKLDDGMGGGGLGKGIFNGGGGGDDGGDDDDYFNEFGDGDGDGDGDGFFRRVFGELYDARAIAAVLEEWGRTVADFPAILRQAAAMGLFSSAALVRFMSLDVRPSVTRFVTRALPPAAARGVVGRLMADPAFAQKLVLEQAITVGASLAYERRVRGDAFWRELDLVAANTAALAAANAALVYLVAPTRAAPAPGRHGWQNALAALPNNVFEPTTPLRAYAPPARAAAFFLKAAELCGVGMAAGAAQAALGRAALAARRAADPGFEPSVPPPGVRRAALGMATAWGLFANARYQVIAGLDRYLFEHASYLWSYLALSGAVRAVSTAVGDQTRVYLQGLPAEAPGAAAAAAARLAAYRRQAAAAAAAAAAAGPPKRRRRRRRPAAAPAGFEMGVGPAPVGVAPA